MLASIAKKRPYESSRQIIAEAEVVYPSGSILL